MNCLNCRGALEFAGGGAYARCLQCLAIYSVSNGVLTPVQVQAPGGGNNPEFNDVFAQQLGFPPRRPVQPALQQSVTFSAGGVGVRITGPTAEGMVQHAKSTLLLWLIIGGVVLVAGGVTAFIMWRKMKSDFDKDMSTVNAALTSVAAGPGAGTPAKPAWDGKGPFTCAGSDHVHIEGVTANLSAGTAITAGASCEVELVNVTITAPVALEANNGAHILVKGGSIKGTTSAAVANNAAEISFTGTKVEGPTKKTAAGKISGP